MEVGRLDTYVAEEEEIVTNLNRYKKTRILAVEEELRKLDFTDKLEYAKEQAIRDVKIEVATAMIENNLPLDQIVLCTKLSKAEICKLKSEMDICH